MLTISSIRLAHVILVFRAAHSLAAGKSLRRRFGPDRSQPGGVERGMRPLLNAGHDPAEYVAIARAELVPNRSRNVREPPIARSSSLFGIRLPGYCLPFLFHKLLTVHRFLEASDTVVGESASCGRVGPHQCSEPERSVARRFLIPAKGCEAAKPLLAHTSDVAIGLLRDRGACKRERGDGG
jgi:hypothetical protein